MPFLQKAFLGGLCGLSVLSSALAAADSPAPLWEEALPAIRAGRQDLAIRPDRWETRFTLPILQPLFSDPLSTPDAFSEWMKPLRSPVESARWVAHAAGLLGVKLPAGEAASIPLALQPAKKFPPDTLHAIENLTGAIAAAQPVLQKAVDSLPIEDRRALATAWLALVRNSSEADAWLREHAPKASGFDLAALFQAAHQVATAADRALPVLQRDVALVPKKWRRRWSFPFGDVMVCGPRNQRFTSRQLDNVALLIHFGGKHVYDASLAGAQEGQIRVVIDLAEAVQVTSSDGPTAGAGLFGIGLLYLPNVQGQHSIQTASLSQGAGLFGVGGLFVAGPNVRLTAHNFAQGAGAFGAGFLSHEQGESAFYQARFAAQGLGVTQGLGVFLHEGDRSTLECGLTEADPREPQAFTSLCQGVGYGVRAMVAGGIGLTAIHGANNSLASSYFSQGSGYWHAFGGLLVEGDANRLQSRRYSQGAGVHTALGHLQMKGSHNRTINWGVGPGYGWDYGVGTFVIDGNDNVLYGEWGTGHGEANGHSLSLIRGDRNALHLPDFGSGAISRNAPSYAVAIVAGSENRRAAPYLKDPISGAFDLPGQPWGLFRATGDFKLDPTLAMEKPIWPGAAREKEIAEERKRLEKRLQRASAQREPRERIRLWLTLAASFALDDQLPRQAREMLMGLSAPEIPALVALVSPDSIDEFVQLRLIFSALGPLAAPALLHELRLATGLRRMLLLSFLSMTGVDESIDALKGALADSDWRVRRAAVLGLGSQVNREGGRSLGRIALLRAAHDLTETTEPVSETALAERFRQTFLSDLLFVLGLHAKFPQTERIAFTRLHPNFHDPVPAPVLKQFVLLLRRDPGGFKEAIESELAKIGRVEREIHALLARRLTDSEPEVVQAALIALGGEGAVQDAPVLTRFLSAPTALVREAAATALGKMGRASRATLRKALTTGSLRLRQLAAVAIAQTSSEQVSELLPPLLHSPQLSLSLTALSGLCQPYSPLRALRPQVMTELQSLAAKGAPGQKALAASLPACLP